MIDKENTSTEEKVKKTATKKTAAKKTEDAAAPKAVKTKKAAAPKTLKEKKERVSGVKAESTKKAAKTAKATKAPAVEVSMANAAELANTIAKILDDKKGKDISIVALNGKTIIADYFVIASVTSSTAVKALTEIVDEKLSKDFLIEPLRRDIDAKWAAIDYGSVILHVFYEETRVLYALEKLWDTGDNIVKYENK